MDTLTYISDASDSAEAYAFAAILQEDDGTTTEATVVDSKFVISDLRGNRVLELAMPDSVYFDDTSKMISVRILNSDLAFATRDMDCVYEWWIQLDDDRTAILSEGNTLVERGL